MISFLKSHKTELLILAIWTLFLNIYYLFNRIVGIDTEQAMIDINSNLNWTLGSGRFASALLRKIIMPTEFNYSLAIVLMVIGWILVGAFYQFVLEQFSSLNSWESLLFVLIFISCPIWSEQKYFTCSVYINVYGILLSVIFSYLLQIGIDNGFNVGRIISLLVIGVITIGIYQALLYLLLANSALFVTANSKNPNKL